MYKSFYRIALVAICAAATLTACSTSEEKLEDARENVDAANEELNAAEVAYQEDVAMYRRLSNERITANGQRIADFNARIAKDKLITTEEYKKDMADLNQKNSDLQKKIDGYELSTQDKWETFKMEFSREMDEINAKIEDLTNSESK
jgi:hypothetical protein